MTAITAVCILIALAGVAYPLGLLVEGRAERKRAARERVQQMHDDLQLLATGSMTLLPRAGGEGR